MDPAKLDEAVQYSIANENPGKRDLALDLALTFGAREPSTRSSVLPVSGPPPTGSCSGTATLSLSGATPGGPT